MHLQRQRRTGVPGCLSCKKATQKPHENHKKPRGKLCHDIQGIELHISILDITYPHSCKRSVFILFGKTVFQARCHELYLPRPVDRRHETKTGSAGETGITIPGHELDFRERPRDLRSRHENSFSEDFVPVGEAVYYIIRNLLGPEMKGYSAGRSLVRTWKGIHLPGQAGARSGLLTLQYWTKSVFICR